MSQTLQIIIGICAGLITIIVAVGQFYKWHSNSIKELQKQIDNLNLQMKDLEKKDELQQQTIDQLNNLFPIISQAIEKIDSSKKITK